MLFITLLIFFVFGKSIDAESWNTSSEIYPWESYLELGDIQRPLGLTLNRSSLAHHHFAIGYLSLHSFMYDIANEAFNLALNITPTFIEPYIGKMLACGQEVYDALQSMLNNSNITLSYLQSSLISTVHQWYPNSSNIEAGEVAFLSSITALSQKYSNETDIHVLWGLSLLNVADQTQYQSQMEPINMKLARVVLIDALKSEPNHPGALHYLIHAYDVVQVDIAEQARQYAYSYGNLVKTSSHAQHMPSHIWMRTGAWNLAVSADGTAIIVSYALCATKLLNHTVSISSTELKSVLALFNNSDGVSSLLFCDAENRAHSTEWLSYTRLQTGNWIGSVSLLQDLFIANNQSTRTPNHYLPFAYRTQARTIVELFFWFPYNDQFLNRTQQLLALNGTQTLISADDNTTRWYPIWSEAGIRFSECLRLLTVVNTSINISTINNHLDRLAILSNRSSSLNQYVSASISMMISQIRGIQYYINQSWQECLNELNNAAQREATLVADANTPTLIFARSSELLAMHLLLIYTKSQAQITKIVSSNYTLNGTQVSINEFPKRALALYQKANSSAPNRSINLLGMARANVQLHNDAEAVRLYEIVLAQMKSSNNSDPIFIQEANEMINSSNDNHNSATTNKSFFVSFIFIICSFYL